MHWIDPACLSEIRGRVSQFLLNPHGEIDGLILNGHLQIHVPPHLSRKLSRRIAPGDRIRVRGVKPRGADVIDAVLLTARDGSEILDEGPDHAAPAAPRSKGSSMETSGEVAMSLHGPKGELRGALLTNGISLRMPPDAAEELADYLRPGSYVQAWGRGVKSKHGVTLDVSEIAEPGDEVAN